MWAWVSEGVRAVAGNQVRGAVLVADDQQLRLRLAEPFATITREAHEHSDDGGKEAEHEHEEPTHVVCSRKTLWVDLRRAFENPCQHLITLSLRRSRGFYKQG